MRLILGIVFYFTFSYCANAFTVLSSPPIKFPDPKITVNVAGNSCAAAGFTNQELLEWTGEAIDDFWNTVTTSSIELSLGTLTSDDLSGVTDDNYSSVYNGLTSGTILIACNDLTTNFDASPNLTNSTLAVGSINYNSSSQIVGLVLINTSAAYTVDHTQDVATIAHEIGHALGLGHSSNDAALMYYSAVAVNERLAEDDRDGITYLYPQDNMTSCGSVALLGNHDDDDFSGPLNFAFGFILMLLLMGLVGNILKRAEKRIVLLN